MRITRAQLLKVMPNAGSRADTYLPIINGWAEHFHINTPLRMARTLRPVARLRRTQSKTTENSVSEARRCNWRSCSTAQ